MACIKKIKALLICPNELPKVVEIPNTLKSFQAQVNGKIAVSYLLKDDDVMMRESLIYLNLIEVLNMILFMITF